MGALADWVTGLGKGVVNMLGSGVAGVRDLGSLISTGKLGDETAKWQMFMTGADNAKDAQMMSAGQALNSATKLSDLALMLGTGGASKALTSGAGAVAANAAQGIAGGFADELEQKGANWSGDDAIKRMVAGSLSGAATAGLGNGINSAITGKSGNKLLNNAITRNTIGRGAVTGALGGAIGGGVMASMNGGDVLGTALATAADGAIGGAVSAGAMSAAQKLGSKAINKLWDAQANHNAVNRLAQGIEQGTDGDIKFARMSKDVFDDINKIRVANGLDPLTERQVTAYQNTVNNHLGKRVREGMSAQDVAQMAFNSLTSKDAKGIPGYYENQLAVSQPGIANDYDSSVIGLAKDGGTSLKSVAPRDANQVDSLMANGQQKSGPKSRHGSPLATNQTEVIDSSALGDADSLGARNQSIAQNTNDVNMPESHEGKNLRLKSAEALLDQYGTIDKPMARSANAIENVQKVADAGFTKPGEVEDIISKVTGANGKVSKMTQKLVNTAQPVDTTSDIGDIVDEQIALNGLAETSEGKAVKKTIEAQLNRLESRRNGTITGTDNPEDVFDVIKALEKRSADLKGKSGNNYRLTTPERTDQARVIDSVTEVLKDRLYSGADMSKIMTAETAAELKSYAPKNEKWANYVDNTIMKSRDIGELRSSMAPFVNMGKVIENQYMNYGTYGSQMSQTAKSTRSIAGKLSDIPVVGKVVAPIAEITLNSNTANRARASIYNNLADKADAKAARQQAKINDSSVANGSITANAIPEAKVVNNATQRASASSTLPYNALGREIGLIESNDVMVNGQQSATTPSQIQRNAIANTTGASNKPVFQLEDGRLVSLEETATAMQNAKAKGDIAAYNELGQIYTALQQATDSGATGTIGSMVSMQNQRQKSDILSQLEMIAEAAFKAGDIQAFNQAATLYKSAQAIFGEEEQKKTELSSSDKTTLQNLNTSLNSLDELERLYEQAGGAQGGVNGSLTAFFDFMNGRKVDTYNNFRNSLGTAIVKNFINLGATEADAKRYEAMLPSVTDNAEQAAEKFATLRRMIQQAQQGVYAQYQ